MRVTPPPLETTTEGGAQRPSTANVLRNLFRSTTQGLGSITVKGKDVQQISDVQICAETCLNVSVWCLDVSKSGVLVGCDDGTVRLMNADLDDVALIDAHRGAVTTVTWHTDGIHFLSIGVDRCVRVWSIASFGRAASNSQNAGKMSPVPRAGSFDSYGSLASSHNNQSAFKASLVTSSSSSRFGTVAGVQPILSVPHSCAVTAAVFDPRAQAIDDNQPSSVWLMSSGTDGRVRAWRGPLLDQYESVAPPSGDPKNERLPSSLAARLESASQSSTMNVSRGNNTGNNTMSVPGYTSSSGIGSVAAGSVLVAVGCANGMVIVYRYTDGFFTVRAQLHCKNRQGKYRNGARVVSIQWIGENELAISTHDDRVRLLRFSGKELIPVGKFKGHVNQSKSPLGAFIIRPRSASIARRSFTGTPMRPAAVPQASSSGTSSESRTERPSTVPSPLKTNEGVITPITTGQRQASQIPSSDPAINDSYILSGSEDGNVFIWRRDATGVSKEGVETGDSFESFLAVEKPDRLTACVPAPWEPEAIDSAARLPACTVVGSLNGWIRVFYNRGAPISCTK